MENAGSRTRRLVVSVKFGRHSFATDRFLLSAENNCCSRILLETTISITCRTNHEMQFAKRLRIHHKCVVTREIFFQRISPAIDIFSVINWILWLFSWSWYLKIKKYWISLIFCSIIYEYDFARFIRYTTLSDVLKYFSERIDESWSRDRKWSWFFYLSNDNHAPSKLHENWFYENNLIIYFSQISIYRARCLTFTIAFSMLI